jgi:hypothetical protein
VGVLIVAAVTAGAWHLWGDADDSTTSWGTVRRGDLVQSVETTGTLQAVETSRIGPPQVREMWQFKIAKLAPEGTEVKSGTPVVSFDATELDQRLQQAMAEADAARAEIEKVDNELSITRQAEALRQAEARAGLRKAELKVDQPGELVAATELASARLDLELARIEIAYLDERRAASERSAAARLKGLRHTQSRAERTVADLEDAIAAMTRTAPRDGTVIYVSDWQGEKKKVGDSCWRAESVLELPDLDAMRGQGQVHEADAGRVLVGQPVRLRLDAHPDVEFAGRVASIWLTVQRESFRSPQKVVRIDVAMDETDPKRMRPGMRFRGEIEIDRAKAALLVPVSAVRPTPEGPVVLRRAWRGTESVPVKLGRRGAETIEVLDGLDEGDVVALVDAAGVRDA